MRTLLLLAGGVLASGCSMEKQAAVAAVDASVAAGPAIELTVLVTGSENGYLLPTADEQGVLRGGAAEALGRWVAGEGHCAGPLGKNAEAACKDGSTVLLSTGDNGNGAAISSVFHGEPTAALMRHMGYAASVFGNHEADFGRPQFSRNRQTAAMPYLAANIPPSADADSTAPLALQPSLVVTRRGVAVGVVGLTTQKTPSTAMPGRLDNITMLSDEQALATAVPALKQQQVAAVVVLTDGCLNELATLLDKHPEWQVSLAAGRQCDTAFPATAGGARLVYAGRHFNEYGRAKLKFEGGKLKKVDAETLEVVAAAGAPPPEPKAAELIAGWKKQLDEMLGAPIGFTAKGIDLGSPKMTAWLATAFKERFGADVGLINNKGARQNLPTGPITGASVYDLIPFENFLVVLKVPGSELVKQLDNPEARFVGVRKQGARYVDPKGKPIDLKKTYSVATHNFIFFGGDGFSFSRSDSQATFTGVPWQTAVIEWTKKLGSTQKKPLESLLK